jgi:uncharacterized protein (DUF1800 family)
MLRRLAGRTWNFETAAHLLNRAGFGGSPVEIEHLAGMSQEQAVSHFVDYESVPDPAENPDWAKPDPDRVEKLRAARNAPEAERRKMQQGYQETERQHAVELRRWWLERMATGPRPLQEKMVLFWHGHFATSMTKVRDAYLMWRQNDLFRRLATGNWQEMLVAVGKDPAMLIWLDQAQSRKEHPNENFAREIMELFALGEGHYTEKDVTEAARALTGWSYARPTQQFIERPFWHDRGQKVIFGHEGNFDGEGFIELLVAQPQAARFITAKLWKYFAGEDASPEMVTALAAEFRQGGNNFKPVLRAMFASEEFYAPGIIRNQIKSPVQWLVGSVRMLDRPLPAPMICVGLTRNLGQDLFAPPNVKGWDGGLSWITTATLLARYNEAATLVLGDLAPMAGALGYRPNKARPNLERRLENARIRGVDVDRLLSEGERANRDALTAALEKRLLQAKLKPEQEKGLREYLDAQADLSDEVILNAIRLVMATPDYQVT